MEFNEDEKAVAISAVSEYRATKLADEVIDILKKSGMRSDPAIKEAVTEAGRNLLRRVG